MHCFDECCMSKRRHLTESENWRIVDFLEGKDQTQVEVAEANEVA